MYETAIQCGNNAESIEWNLWCYDQDIIDNSLCKVCMGLKYLKHQQITNEILKFLSIMK